MCLTLLPGFVYRLYCNTADWLHVWCCLGEVATAMDCSLVGILEVLPAAWQQCSCCWHTCQAAIADSYWNRKLQFTYLHLGCLDSALNECMTLGACQAFWSSEPSSSNVIKWFRDEYTVSSSKWLCRCHPVEFDLRIGAWCTRVHKPGIWMSEAYVDLSNVSWLLTDRCAKVYAVTVCSIIRPQT